MKQSNKQTNKANNSSIERLRDSRIAHRALPLLLPITPSPLRHLRVHILIHHLHGGRHGGLILRQTLLLLTSTPLPHSEQDEFQDVLLEPIERIADSARRHLRNLHLQLAQNRVQPLLRVVREERRRDLRRNAPPPPLCCRTARCAARRPRCA